MIYTPKEKRIAFKEMGQLKYYRSKSGQWVQCGEHKISELYKEWVQSKYSKRQRKDEQGFWVFDYEQ